MFSILDIITLAIRLEENGEAVYRAAVKMTQDPEIRCLLERIAEEEKSHARWFSELKETIKRDEDRHILEEMRRSLADDFFGDQTFSLKDFDFTSIQTLEELMEVAIVFEKDSILFYEMLRPFASGENTSETLGRIIDEENMHIQRLKDLFPKIARVSG